MYKLMYIASLFYLILTSYNINIVYPITLLNDDVDLSLFMPADSVLLLNAPEDGSGPTSKINSIS